MCGPSAGTFAGNIVIGCFLLAIYARTYLKHCGDG